MLALEETCFELGLPIRGLHGSICFAGIAEIGVMINRKNFFYKFSLLQSG
jgi:hypothetical protein